MVGDNMKPMTLEEALDQMGLLVHRFSVFLDAADQSYALLYKREHGDYGLIAPEPA